MVSVARNPLSDYCGSDLIHMQAHPKAAILARIVGVSLDSVETLARPSYGTASEL